MGSAENRKDKSNEFECQPRLKMSESTSTSSPARPNDPDKLPPKPVSGRKRRRWIWVVVALAIVLAVGGIFLLRHRGQSQSEIQSTRGRGGSNSATIVVSSATAQQGDIGIYVNALGVITPLNTVSVNSRVTGQIVKVNYQEGQLVHVGDPLVEIDPGPNQAALTQVEGQLERDTALLEDAKLDLERYQEAFASNAIPKQQFDTQLATVHQYEGTVKLDQGQLDNAKVQLAYCYITAPISGRVGLRLVDGGNIVQASATNPLLVIAELQPIAVIFNVAEDDLPQIQKQLRQNKKLSVEAFDRAQTKKIATGLLETLDNQIDATTGTVKFKAIFTNDDEALFPNQFVNVRLLVNTLHDVTLVPNTVIQRNADSAFVYLLKPDQTGTNQTVAMQTITVGTTDGNVSSVEGIDPGAVVAADNFNKLTDGAKVTVRAPTNSTNETNSAMSPKRTHKKNPQ
jgi:multidrug efflux system membrane fusion protein